jgi:HPt (histidine-containing phosphotransfer) domain-containing protein
MSTAIDQKTFSELQSTAGTEFVAELVDTFLQEAPGMLAELRSAAAEIDAVRFRRAAHSLKSNSHTFGALPLGALARELEVNGIGDSTAVGARLDALEAEYERAAAVLKELCRG